MRQGSRQHPPLIREGMTVYSADGYRVGRVAAVGVDEFEIEKGTFFRRDRRARLADVKEVKGSEVYLSRRREALARLDEAHERLPAREARTEATEVRDRSPMGEHFGENASPLPDEHMERGERIRRDVGSEELRIPVASEELEVVKRASSRMAARIHKRVVTEIRELRVPVRREELVIEKVPITDPEARAAQAEFKEERFVIPLVEEEIEIRKHPRVREQVVIRRQSTTEERRLKEPVRREVIEVEGQSGSGRPSAEPSGEPTGPPAGGCH